MMGCKIRSEVPCLNHEISNFLTMDTSKKMGRRHKVNSGLHDDKIITEYMGSQQLSKLTTSISSCGIAMKIGNFTPYS